jgi:preprotein translocase subunit SecG
LKKTAIISIVFFTACALVYPYLSKANLSTGMKVSQPQNQSANVKLSPEN